jgi:hypothetical protein
MLIILNVLSVRVRSSMMIQSVVVAILGLMILVSFPIIITVQATTNQSLAEIKMKCQWRALNETPLTPQPLSERQCFFFNSCLNLTGGSITACCNAARNISCDIENGPWHCPPVAMNQK